MIRINNDQIRRFNQTDWYGFAGSVRFANGNEPFIAEGQYEGGRSVLLLADAEGVGCHVEDEEGCYYLPLEANELAVFAIVEHLLNLPLITKSYLESNGFCRC